MGYRITLTNATTTRDDHISFPCSIEKETAPDVWTPVDNAPAAILVPARNILGILRRDVDDTTKRQELLLLIKHHTRSLDPIIGDAAIDALEALLPTGWPVTVEL